MAKIIQISTVPVEKVEPMVLGLGDDGGVYQWNVKTGTWYLWGVNNDNRKLFHPTSELEQIAHQVTLKSPRHNPGR